ncbi:hypothetical protein ACU686_34840 [Yinghuangia aomiensis]
MRSHNSDLTVRWFADAFRPASPAPSAGHPPARPPVGLPPCGAGPGGSGTRVGAAFGFGGSRCDRRRGLRPRLR